MFLLAITMLLAGGATAMRGQSALYGFDPNANDRINVVVVQPDGKVLISGRFTTLAPNGGPVVTRNHIARLNADGTVDSAFNPNANERVLSIAVQADGKIVVGGVFQGANSIGGQPRNYIARLDATTGLADSWNPNANNVVESAAVQADGKILAGGGFSVVGGQTRNCIARLDATTGLADSFNPNADNDIHSIVVQTNGKILVGGAFGVVGGQPRNFIARLSADGTADTFDPEADYSSFPEVDTIAVQADGKILAGGYFDSIGGQQRHFIARLDPVTGLADSFDPSANEGVYTIAVQADGKVLAGGYFTTIGGQPRNNIARLNATTGLADSFDPNANGGVRSIALQADGKILAGGDFTLLSPNGGGAVTRNHMARLETDGRVDQTQVFSRKLHNGVPFDVNLPLVGTAGIECRSGGASNDYQIVFAFPNAVTFNGASVTAGAGSVSGSSGNGTNTITINLTGVTNAQRITVTLQGVSNGTSTGDVGVQMGVLVGDTNGNGVVNASDVGQTKAQIGQGITGSNFRTDVNVNGTINATDVSLVKARIGTSIPTAAEGTKLASDSDRAFKSAR